MPPSPIPSISSPRTWAPMNLLTFPSSRRKSHPPSPQLAMKLSSSLLLALTISSSCSSIADARLRGDEADRHHIRRLKKDKKKGGGGGGKKEKRESDDKSAGGGGGGGANRNYYVAPVAPPPHNKRHSSRALPTTITITRRPAQTMLLLRATSTTPVLPTTCPAAPKPAPSTRASRK